MACEKQFLMQQIANKSLIRKDEDLTISTQPVVIWGRV
jgi:hypothetical protein